MNAKRVKLLTITAIAILLITVVGLTYAFFQTQGENLTSKDIFAKSYSTDYLSFQISNDIDIRVTQADFAPGAGNKSGSSTVTATLSPNNYTGNAKEYYYVFLNIDKNEIGYSSTNTNLDPELLLEILDEDNNLVSIPGLEPKTVSTERVEIETKTVWYIEYSFPRELIIPRPEYYDSQDECEQDLQELRDINYAYIEDVCKSKIATISNTITEQITGYDLTGQVGYVSILNNHKILAKNHNPKEENWQVRITLINHDFNQNDNTNKEVSASIVIGKVNKGRYLVSTIDDVCDDGDELGGCIKKLYTKDGENSLYNHNDTMSVTLYGYNTSNVTNSIANLLWKDIDCIKEMMNDTKICTSPGHSDYDNETIAYIDLSCLINLTDDELIENYGDYACDNTNQDISNYELSNSDIKLIENVEALKDLYNPQEIKYDLVSANDNSYRFVPSYDFVPKRSDKALFSNNDDSVYKYNYSTAVIGLTTYIDAETGDEHSYVYSSQIGVTNNETGEILSSENNIINDAYDLYINLPNNNYVCFGTNETPCPEDNIYQIIGVIPTKLANGTTKDLVKLVKYTPATENELGTNGSQFAWSSIPNATNDWRTSDLNTVNLNTNYLHNIGSNWAALIEEVEWQLGGFPSEVMEEMEEMESPYDIYDAEIVHPSSNITYNAKIGLPYLSDYFYSCEFGNYICMMDDVVTITKDSSTNDEIYRAFYAQNVTENNYGIIKPSFYLKENVSISGQHEGTLEDPIRLSVGNNNDTAYCSNNFEDEICQIDMNYSPYKGIAESGNGYIYNFADGNEEYYRFVGANPNNYICFGSNENTCPDTNLYRIIGKIPVEAVKNNTTETQYLYKLIKNDYITETELGMTSAGNASKVNSYSGPSGNMPTGNVAGFKWCGESNSNSWANSTLNTNGLNNNYLNNLGSTWSDKIETVIWKVGGISGSLYYKPITEIYRDEITNPLSNDTVTNKVGLMYVSDYGYAAKNDGWLIPLNSIHSYEDSYYKTIIKSNDWLYKGVNEWTISPIIVNSTGTVGGYRVDRGNGVRPSFYLKSNITIDIENHSGSISDPFRIN